MFDLIPILFFIIIIINMAIAASVTKKKQAKKEAAERKNFETIMNQEKVSRPVSKIPADKPVASKRPGVRKIPDLKGFGASVFRKSAKKKDRSNTLTDFRDFEDRNNDWLAKQLREEASKSSKAIR